MALKQDLGEATAATFSDAPDESDAEAWLVRYDTVLGQLLDRHAPFKEAVVVQKARAPWYTEEIAEAKRLRRRLEKQWKKTRLTIHHDIFKKQKNFVTSLISRARTEFYCDRIEECQGDQKSLFRVADRLLHRKTTDSCGIAAEKMSDFFEKKISDIWNELQRYEHGEDERIDNAFVEPFRHPPPDLQGFLPASEEEIVRIVGTMSNATCTLDPMPTHLVKQHLDVLAPLITAVVNSSLRSGCVPAKLKEALVRPRLKKNGLDPTDPKSYRPVSNIAFVGKVIERVVAARINAHAHGDQPTA